MVPNRLILTVLAGLLASLSSPSARAVRGAPPATIAAVSWMAGDWVGRKGQVVIEERWTPPAGGAMLAVSRTLKGERLAAFEFLRIAERDGSLVYIAQPGGRPPSEFVLSAVGAASATFENPSHDFPKVIRYTRLPDGTLEARVSDGGDRVEVFVFRRGSS